MVFAVPVNAYAKLKAAGELDRICDEICNSDFPALLGRVARGELIQAKDAVTHAAGDRDRCYMPDCGDEVTVCYRKKDKAHYFRHLTNSNCIGDPSNPPGAKQR